MWLSRLVAAAATMCATALAQLPGAAEELKLEGQYLRLKAAPAAGGAVTYLGFVTAEHNVAAGGGLLQEGFGTPSLYVPNRRLYERLEPFDNNPGRPGLRYIYDCDGPNISGLRVTRTLEAPPDETGFRVTWRLENRGDDDQWISPWVRNDLSPGGQLAPLDRLDLPTISGILQPKQFTFHPASRNWAAVTDPIAMETVYAVFHADHIHSFLSMRESDYPQVGFQAVFVPRVLRAGHSWETKYRVNMVRGLQHVNFASDELAAQIDYSDGRLTVLLAVTRDMPQMQMRASVTAPNGRVWRLPAKQFKADPARLIRCSYDWTAPADGAYEFLAQFYMYGAAYNIAPDTASPHGGMDAQFVVGEPEDTTFEPWTDAPFALERGPRTLRRGLAVESGSTQIWIESPLEKIFRKDRAEASGRVENTVRLSLARNERESFQIVVRPDDGEFVRNIAFEAGPLEHTVSDGRIDPEHLQPHLVNYHAVRVPSHFEGPTGLWPDALPPYAPFTAEGGEAHPVWFTLYAPPDTPPGRYRGQLEMRSRDLDPVRFILDVRVHDFELPQTPMLKTDFGYDSGEAYLWSRARGYRGSREALDSAYFAHALERRVTLRDLAAFPDAEGGYGARLAAFERRLDAARRQGATTHSVPPALLDWPAQLQLANEFVRSHNLQNRVFVPLFDQPFPPAWPGLVEQLGQWREFAPDIPIMVTTAGLQPFLHDEVGIWAVHLQMLDTANARPILERVQDGTGEVWGYVNHGPSRPYPNLFVDFAAIEHRILFWQLWALGMKGFHYWAINYSPEGQDPWDNLVDFTPVNGDGFLVYPSANGPVTSIRWETIRDGIEDFEYLTILRQRMEREKARAGETPAYRQAEQALNLNRLLPSLVTFSRDPLVLESQREEIARAIEALGQ